MSRNNGRAVNGNERRLDHREYLKGRASWDHWFDQVHAIEGGTVQWWTAKALS